MLCLQSRVTAYFASVGHGQCHCGRCDCKEGWTGKKCEHPVSCSLSVEASQKKCRGTSNLPCHGRGTSENDCFTKAKKKYFCKLVFSFHATSVRIRLRHMMLSEKGATLNCTFHRHWGATVKSTGVEIVLRNYTIISESINNVS